MAGFKKPFKAVPLKSTRLKGLDEFDRPLWNPPRSPEPFPWLLAGIGLFIGASFGLAFILI